eukprot:CAMPEP_0179033234 /NCGR_PEP_ID=MMETSP0796-20121207/12000_1 /TAXON_ID=73915 /ORGANISM="Pyrodinium bahamense, Strain pbaha01" /LENGTH=310 /DNA_ID=CAMNT_0020729489 /DNA_START=93 /DNA_END=1025 /DNA_ORIENTATION=-
MQIQGSQQEIDDLDSAWDSMCTLSSSPGTAVVQQQDFRVGKEQHSTVAVQVVECLATVNYTDDGIHSGGSTHVKVFAGYDFALRRDADQWCASALSGVWLNAKFLNRGREREIMVNGQSLATPSEWECGDRGWVGCRTRRDCTHHFGEPPSFSDDLDGYSFVSTTPSRPSCLSARDGARIQCSIDAHDQVRLGSTRELLRREELNVQEAEQSHKTLAIVAYVLMAIGGSCILMALSSSCECQRCAKRVQSQYSYKDDNLTEIKSATYGHSHLPVARDRHEGSQLHGGGPHEPQPASRPSLPCLSGCMPIP